MPAEPVKGDSKTDEIGEDTPAGGGNGDGSATTKDSDIGVNGRSSGDVVDRQDSGQAAVSVDGQEFSFDEAEQLVAKSRPRIQVLNLSKVMVGSVLPAAPSCLAKAGWVTSSCRLSNQKEGRSSTSPTMMRWTTA